MANKFIDTVGLTHIFSKIKTHFAKNDLSNVDNDVFAEKAQTAGAGIAIVTTTGDGAAYAASVPGVTKLYVGLKVTIIPHTVSTTTLPTLNINGLGAKNIKQPAASDSASSYEGLSTAWLAAGKPVTVTYEGGYFDVDFTRSDPKCTTIEDWNSAVENGWFMGNNAANAPANVEAGGTLWFFGTVIAHNENYVFQEVYQFTASNDARSNKKYIRSCKEGVWGEWYEVTVQRNVPVDSKLDYIKTLVGDAQTQIDNKLDAKPSLIEFNTTADADHGGYLDFHYAGSTEDYTSRIIEDEKGHMRIIAANGILVPSISPATRSLRNIYAGTTDMTAGSSSLATGEIYLKYK